MTDPSHASPSDAAPPPPPLLERLPPLGETVDADEALDRFLDYVASLGIELYPAQEEAILELYADRHAILSTPTGSGKTLVATALHFRALCEDRTAFYTAPIKALVSEKFFELCRLVGPENVGMLTGDASVNHGAPIICCTAEVLSNLVLAGGEDQHPDYVVMDEFHYYGDRDRGMAWQIPLIACPNARFLLMSATLGDVEPIAERLEADSGRPVARITSARRPVPLDYEYRETPLHQTIEVLLEADKAPVYVVSFTQREAAELAQQLTSLSVGSKESRRRIARALSGERFGTPYGRDIERILRAGVGVHHAGLLPRYRLLVERLSQQGLLKVICGTDTLGVGVNIPIRTVVFTKLAKYDGRKVRVLRVRDFKQIAGRAGRKGFDEQGSVIAQAPEHVIANTQLAAKKAAAASKGRKVKGKAKQAEKGEVVWTKKTFDQLIARPPEPLRPRFRVTHGVVLTVLQRGRDGVDRDPSGGYRFLVELIGRSRGGPADHRRHLQTAAERFRALRRAGIVELEPGPDGRRRVRLRESLQEDFSLHQTLSLWLLDAMQRLDPMDPAHALNVVSLVEASLEDPRVVLYAQENRLKGELVARLKAEGVDYEERMARLDEVSWPKPLSDFIYGTFELFAEDHPWLHAADLSPKSVVREMLERYDDFPVYVQRYGLQRSEGVLLLYLNEAYKAISRTLPEAEKTDELRDVEAFLRLVLERVDSSIIDAWQHLVDGETGQVYETEEAAAYDLARDERALAARARAEMHGLLQALAARDYEAAAEALRPAGRGDAESWDAARLEEALAPYYQEHERIVFDHAARRTVHTQLRPLEARRWAVLQSIVDPEESGRWALHGEIDLRPGRAAEGPLLALLRVEG